jgi:hypothetical protein
MIAPDTLITDLSLRTDLEAAGFHRGLVRRYLNLARRGTRYESQWDGWGRHPERSRAPTIAMWVAQTDDELFNYINYGMRAHEITRFLRQSLGMR